MSIRKVILSAFALAAVLASCTKNELQEPGREVAFQTASYATRVGIDGTVFPTSETFGVYAWEEGSTGDYFMDNDQAYHNSSTGLWNTNPAFYWPTEGTLDFEGFYPYGLSGVAVTPNKITYTGYDVEAGQEDVMYSSKSVGFGDNPDGSGAGIDGSGGVPILFHHALSKVTVAAKLGFDRMEEPDGTVYEWEVTVNRTTLSDFYKKGDSVFELSDETAVGLVEWVKPTDEDGNRVWTNDGVKTSKTQTGSYKLDAENPVVILPEFFTLPQALDSLGQNVTINFTVKTKRNGEEFLSETLTRSAYLRLRDLPAWEINHKITYTLFFNPIDLGPAGKPSIISFDPAVDDWEVITASTIINV